MSILSATRCKSLADISLGVILAAPVVGWHPNHWLPVQVSALVAMVVLSAYTSTRNFDDGQEVSA